MMLSRSLLWVSAVGLAFVDVTSVARAQALDSARAQIQKDSARKADSTRRAAVTADSVRVADILRLRRQIEADSKTFHFGLSLGWRRVFSGSGGNREAAINPATLKVESDGTDHDDFVLSGIVTAFPLKRSWSPLGFVANVNLASFTSDNIATFNKSIEGGGGLAWRLAPDFAVGFTIERMFNRSLREFVQFGNVLVAEGDTVKTLSKDDGRFFRDDNLTAWSVKFLYFLK